MLHPANLLHRPLSLLLTAAIAVSVMLGACHPFEDTNEDPFDDAVDVGDLNGDLNGDGTDIPSDGTTDGVDGDVDPTDLVDGSDMDLNDIDASGECALAADCEDLHGVAPCGAWTCNQGQCDVVCENCTDADGDGYGEGAGCAGPDCDDTDQNILSNLTRSCYSGLDNTAGVGVCTAGVEQCRNGIWLPCRGEVVPGGEACNGLDDNCSGTPDDLPPLTCGVGACETTVDACTTSGGAATCIPSSLSAAANDTTCDGVDDDCDGAIDEDCTSQCVRVTPLGVDSIATGTPALPFGSIEAAISFAANSGLTRVCVAGGPDCTGSSRRTYSLNGELAMQSGISVYGDYKSVGWTQCRQNSPITVIEPGAARGVVFDGGSETTVLDGFEVKRANESVTTAITVDGATNVILSNLDILSAAPVQRSRGITIVNGGDATVTRSTITGGRGSVETTGIWVQNSSVYVTSNCRDGLNNGRCDSYCAWRNTGPRGIRGFLSSESVPRTTGISQAIFLENSPGSIVEQSSICSGEADESYGVRIAGDAADTAIRTSHVSAFGGSNHSYAVFSQGCAGSTPAISNNDSVLGESSGNLGPGHGIHVLGDCHPVIDNNRRISGGSEGVSDYVAGVYCGQRTTGASRCTVLSNERITGNQLQSLPQVAVGVECEGACGRVENNEIWSGSGLETAGLRFTGGRGLVAGNRIIAGCPGTDGSMAVKAIDSSARIENNLIGGGVNCDASGERVGLGVFAGDPAQELDVHSNIIDSGGHSGANCTSYALFLDESNVDSNGPIGIYRNNIIRAADCANGQYAVYEADRDVDPRIFENNNLLPIGVLYEDADDAAIASIAGVNGLADITSSGNISADPGWVSYPADFNLQANSACVNQGTRQGAPATDFDGDSRDSSPDIGPQEFLP